MPEYIIICCHVIWVESHVTSCDLGSQSCDIMWSLLLNKGAHQVNVIGQFHLFRKMRLPDGLSQEVVRLAELDGDHDTTMHRLVKVIGTIGG